MNQSAATPLWRELRLAVRLGRRELRAGLREGLRGFGVFFACLAVGVAAVVAVTALSAAVETSLQADSKKLLGGDLEFRRSHLPLSSAAVEYLHGQGAVSVSTRMRAMVRPEAPVTAPDAPPDAALVELKAVDAAYPLYGAVELAPALPVAQALGYAEGVWGAAVDPLLLERLGLRLGDRVRVGQTLYEIRATVAREPDRAASLFSLGPRLMIATESFASTGLDAPGNVLAHVYAFKLGRAGGGEVSAEELEAFKEEFRRRFPENGVQIRDFSTAGTGLKRFMDNLSRYLTLVGLLALLVGGVGVANGARGYLETKLDDVAIMKCLGASRRQTMLVYLFQILCLAGLGAGLGAVLGLGGAWLGAGPVLRQFGLARTASEAIPLWPAGLGLLYGLLTALLFAISPLSAAGGAPAAQLFRGYVDQRRRKASGLARVAVLALVLALLGLTLAAVGKPGVVLGFAGFALVSIALFYGAAWLIARTASSATRFLSGRRSAWVGPRVRLALRNLHRPGNIASDVVFSLGLGLAAMAAITLVDANMQHLIRTQVAEAAPSFFFLDVPSSRVEEFRALVLSNPGASKVEAEPSLRGRIVKIKGVEAEKAEVDPSVDWAIRGDRSLSYAGGQPAKAQIASGAWWSADYQGPPLLCLTSDIGRGFRVAVGDSLTVNVLGRDIEARIACLREVEWLTFALNHAIVFAPGVLEKAPHAFIATASLDRSVDQQDNERTLRRAVQAAFPDVAVIYVKDILDEVGKIMEHIGLAVRATAGITLVVGLLVLAESMRAALRRRYREAVIFKVLGARRADILAMLGLECACLGAATALLAALLGAAASWVFVVKVLERSWSLYAAPLALVCAAGALFTVALGLLGVALVLRKKAWPVLRNE
jgi:putative ABC transport system permease protein